jgi:hypothetical protein
MVSGLGSGLFLFDQNGCPVNPLDANANRQYCNDAAPADTFADQVNNVVYDLDRTVEYAGIPNSSGAHPMQVFAQVPRRVGATNPQMAGPMGSLVIQKLIGGADLNTAKILDSWIDADGNAQGDAANFIQ